MVTQSLINGNQLLFIGQIQYNGQTMNQWEAFSTTRTITYVEEISGIPVMMSFSVNGTLLMKYLFFNYSQLVLNNNTLYDESEISSCLPPVFIPSSYSANSSSANSSSANIDTISSINTVSSNENLGFYIPFGLLFSLLYISLHPSPSDSGWRKKKVEKNLLVKVTYT